MKQKKVAILLSYVNLVMSMAVNVLLTPWMIRAFGDVDYSVYKVMQSFAGPLAMFHLGISTIVTRSIVKCRNSDDYAEKDKQNTMALALMVSVIMSCIVIIAGIIMHRAIPTMYGATYTAENIELGCKIFIIFIFSSVFHMLTDTFSGCVMGHEKFIVSSGVTLMKTVLKLVLISTCLLCRMSVLYVVVVDLVIAVITFLIVCGYAVFALSEIPKLYYFDKRQVIEILSFGMAILLQAIINQVNNNLDTMILGVYIEEKAIITMYSSALAIYAMYNSIISQMTNFMLPKATRLVTENASGKELTDFVVVPGRFQAMIAVAIIFGFALFGPNFISIWIGEKYMDAYWVILMLIIPVTIPLVENAAISILDATLKRIYRSSVLVIMAVLNVIVSIVLIRVIGFWGAALGTVVSLLVGHGILMNMYYSRTFKMEIGRMFKDIFKGILPMGIVTFVMCIPLALYVGNTIILFMIKCTVFMSIYAVLLWKFGINESEKRILIGTLKKRRDR